MGPLPSMERATRMREAFLVFGLGKQFPLECLDTIQFNYIHWYKSLAKHLTAGQELSCSTLAASLVYTMIVQMFLCQCIQNQSVSRLAEKALQVNKLIQDRYKTTCICSEFKELKPRACNVSLSQVKHTCHAAYGSQMVQLSGGASGPGFKYGHTSLTSLTILLWLMKYIP